MTKARLGLLLAMIFVVLPCSSQAQGIPVYDNANYLQIINQLNQMSQQYQKQLEQLDQAVKQTSALTGSRNMGSLANSPLEAELRQYAPRTWQDTLHMINAGDLSGETAKTQSLTSSLYSLYMPVDGADFIESDPSGPIAQAIDRRTQTTYSAMAAGEQAYNNIAGRNNDYQTMLSELDNTPDLKASVDLLARISVENGMSVNEVMRLNAIQIQQRAAQDNEILTSYKRAHDANQYDPAAAAAAFQLKE